MRRLTRTAHAQHMHSTRTAHAPGSSVGSSKRHTGHWLCCRVCGGVWVCVCVCVCLCVYAFVCARVCMCVCTRSGVCIKKNVRIYAVHCAFASCAYVHTCTHTQTHSFLTHEIYERTHHAEPSHKAVGVEEVHTRHARDS